MNSCWATRSLLTRTPAGIFSSEFQTGCQKNFRETVWHELQAKLDVDSRSKSKLILRLDDHVRVLCCLLLHPLPFPASLCGDSSWSSFTFVDAAEWTLIWRLAKFVSQWNMTLNAHRVYWSNTSNTGFQLGVEEDCILFFFGRGDIAPFSSFIIVRLNICMTWCIFKLRLRGKHWTKRQSDTFYCFNRIKYKQTVSRRWKSIFVRSHVLSAPQHYSH